MPSKRWNVIFLLLHLNIITFLNVFHTNHRLQNPDIFTMKIDVAFVKPSTNAVLAAHLRLPQFPLHHASVLRDEPTHVCIQKPYCTPDTQIPCSCHAMSSCDPEDPYAIEPPFHIACRKKETVFRGLRSCDCSILPANRRKCCIHSKCCFLFGFHCHPMLPLLSIQVLEEAAKASDRRMAHTYLHCFSVPSVR